MARDATDIPPNVLAGMDQAAATQAEHDQTPEGVLVQLRIRAVDIGPDDAGVAVSMTTALDNSVQAVACLEALHATAEQFATDILRTMNALMDDHGDDPEVRHEVTMALAMFTRLQVRVGRKS